MEQTQLARARFGTFELDLRAGELQGNGKSVLLPDQVLQVLRILLEHQGELVSRAELKSKLWPNDTVVEFDHGINNTIKRLRKLLDDSADEPKYVETIPRRGYRLMVPVEWVRADEPSIGEASGSNDGTGVRRQPEPGLIGKRVSHYRVLEVIGGGGMGMVYKAEDLKLGRQVALKFLPEDLAGDPTALQRFEREAQTASALNHPNICTIYEVEEHDGQPFIVMELLEGQTLRDRMAVRSGALPVVELRNIAIPTCDGLHAAHEKGIIHRDIKPANIFITSKGIVKILDFGLAKLVGEAPEAVPTLEVRGVGTDARQLSSDQGHESEAADKATPDATLTRTGVAMGTAGYMSPEQVRGEKLDARTDIFSFGLVLYEMATGQRAFTGKTAAVVHNAILHNAPAPVRKLNGTLPVKLVSAIDKALEKDRERRYQSAAEMRAGLQELQEVRPRHMIHARWRRYGAAALILAIAVSGLLYRRAHPPIKLTDKDTLVLAAVINSTGDPLLDDSLDWPLSEELQEAPYINLLNPGKVRETLQSMKLSGDAKLAPDLAREVCVRTNSRAYVTTSVSNAGNDYQIRLQATDCHSGKTLAASEIEAGDRNHIIKMLGIAGHNLRAALGEPADSLVRFAKPVDEDWTSSIEASQAFSRGIRAKHQGNAAYRPLVQRALELDPKFTLAYLDLGGGGAGPDSGRKYLTQAFNLRDRLSERSRFFTEAIYYTFVTGQLEKAKQTYLQWIRTYPADVYSHQSFAVLLRALGQSDEAIVQGQEAVHLMPMTMTYNSLIEPLVYSNRLEEAKVVYEEAKARGIDDLSLPQDRYQVAWLENDTAKMQELLNHAPDTPEGKDWVLAQQGDIAMYQGRFRAAHEFYSANAGYWPPRNEADYAVWDVETGNATRARESAQKALAANPESPMKPLLVLVLARAGDVHQAGELADSIGRKLPASTLVQNYQLPTIRAAMELNAGRAKEAIEILKASAPYELADPATLSDPFGGLYPCYIRGLAYAKLGEDKRAAAEFQKLVDHPGLGLGIPTGPLSYLQLARVQALMGDKAAARKSYQDFLTLWKDADPDIPIYKEAKAEYAKLL